MDEKGRFKTVEIEDNKVSTPNDIKSGQDIYPEQDMSSAANEVPVDIDDQISSTGWLDDITNLFIAPSLLMRSLARKPKILFPLIIMALLGLASAIFMKNTYIAYMLDYIPKQAPNAQGMDMNMVKAGIESTYIMVISGAVVMGIIACLIFALIFWLVGKMVGGRGTYQQILSVYSYSYLILQFGAFLGSIGKMLTGNYYFDFSPLYFIGEGIIKNPAYSILALLNPFVIWNLIVTCIGISKAHQIDSKKSAILVIGLTVIINVLLILPAIYFSKGSMA